MQRPCNEEKLLIIGAEVNQAYEDKTLLFIENALNLLLLQTDSTGANLSTDRKRKFLLLVCVLEESSTPASPATLTLRELEEAGGVHV